MTAKQPRGALLPFFRSRPCARSLRHLRTLLYMILCSPPLLLTAMPCAATLTPLDDSQLAAVAGQNALLNADRIAGTSTGVDAGLSFYRMSLDASVAFNLNINRLQLGCGGINNYIATGCDIDLQYVSFMGENGSGGPGNPVTSDFVLNQPYVELAIANDGTANREVVGFNLGSQSALGYLSVGRVYSQGQYNEENKVTCNTANPITCHSGINSISGSLNVHFQGTIPVVATLFGIPIDHDTATLDQTETVSGTRLSTLDIPDLRLSLSGGFLSLFTGLLGNFQPYGDLTENLRFLHGFAIADDNNNASPSFSISFQRQQVAYPTYDKTGYNATANTGWWLNIPSAQLTGLQAASLSLETTNIPGVIDLLGPPGYPITNAELNQAPTQNCYGAAHFC